MASLFGQFVRYFGVLAVVAVLAISAAIAAPYAAIVIDARTGETLYSKNADTRLHPASLTKMMTLYITFGEIRSGRLSLDTMITVSKHAAAEPPSRLGLRAGQKIALRYLIRAAAVKSANDAAAAIGDAIGGSTAGFAKKMNRTAKSLGMNDSTFRNANGLTASGHMSTARDMTTLGRHLFYDFPEFYNIFSRRSTDAGMAQVASTNRKFLDAYKGADGIKTGYTVPAGFNLTASAERGNVRIIATIFGGQSTAQRNSKMAELLDLGFAKAPSNARVAKPEMPASDAEDALIASASLPDEDEAELDGEAGGSAKTIRLIMAVATSPRPKTRPGITVAKDMLVADAAVDDAVADAMQDGIAGALAEANTPPPADTLEAQTLALSEAPPTPEASLLDAAIADATPVAAAPDTLDAQSQALALGEGLSVQAVPQTAPTDLPRCRPQTRPPKSMRRLSSSRKARKTPHVAARCSLWPRKRWPWPMQNLRPWPSKIPQRSPVSRRTSPPRWHQSPPKSPWPQRSFAQPNAMRRSSRMQFLRRPKPPQPSKRLLPACPHRVDATGGSMSGGLIPALTPNARF